MNDDHFDMGGQRDDVVAALDASIAASPGGELRAAKALARDALSAGPDERVGCTIRRYSSPDGGWTVSISYCVAPAHQDAGQSGEASP